MNLIYCIQPEVGESELLGGQAATGVNVPDRDHRRKATIGKMIPVTLPI
jgi:hypothetical protein